MNRSRIVALAVCAVVAVSVGGCGKGDDAAKAAVVVAPTHESIQMKSVAIMKSVVDALKSVKDDASSKAAATLADVPK